MEFPAILVPRSTLKYQDINAYPRNLLMLRPPPIDMHSK